MDTDRNLLFGVLALQLDLLDRDRFVEACGAWAARKDTPLADLLVERRWLTPQDKADVERLLERKLKKHGGDAHASLAAVASPEVRRALDTVDDVEVEQSLASLPAVEGPASDLPTVDALPAAGRYRVLRPHARGGLGEVFVAEDTELHRSVALKQIQQRHADNAHSRSRFLLEAEITGGLEHPGIVPVYGLGRYPDDRPFYAMRFIQGDSLQEALRRFHQAPDFRGAAFRQLLRRFVDVCNAVAYAHSRGVLHRDLKPANVMLGPFGETLVVDWGLAKVVGRERSGGAGGTVEATLQPASAGSQSETVVGTAIGTPAYMSPEQAAGRLDELGPASDVYSLGATLYAVLTRRAPFEGSDKGEVLRQVQRGEFSPPREVQAAVPPALDAICRRAMALDPAARYPTPLALAADLERWLADEPVSAYRDPVTVRLVRWGRRHQKLVASGTALLLTAVLALAVGLWAVSRERKQTAAANEREREARRQAEANFTLAKDAVDRYLNAVTEDNRLKQQDFFDLRKKLLETALPFYEQFAQAKADDPEQEADRGRAYLRLALLRYELGEREAALADFERTRAIFAQLAADFPTVPEYRQKLAISHNNSAVQLAALGKGPEAEAQSRQALALQEKLAADFPTVPKYREALANSHNTLGLLLKELGKHAEAEAEHRQALALQEKLAADLPGIAEYRRDLDRSHLNLGLLLKELGKHAEAEAEHRQALALQENLAADLPALPDYRRELAISHNNLGVLLDDLGKRPEAEAEYRLARAILEKLVADFPALPDYRRELAQSHNGLGILLADLGKRPEAEAEYHRALALQEKLVADFPTVPKYRRDLAGSHLNLGNLLKALGRRAEAEAAYRQALSLQEKLAAGFPTAPDSRLDLAGGHNNLGTLLAALGNRAEAEAAYRQARALYEQIVADFPTVPKYRRELAVSHDNWGALLADLGKRAEAEAEHRRALALQEQLVADCPTVPEYRQDLARSHHHLGDLLAKLRKRPEAEAEYRQALALEEKLAAGFPTVPAYRRELAQGHNNLGNLLSDLGKRAEAEAEYRQARALQEKLVADCPSVPDYRQDLARSHNNLGLLLAAVGQRTEAEVAYRQAIALYELLAADCPAVPDYRRDLALSHYNLGLLLAAVGQRTEAEVAYRQAIALYEKLATDCPTVPDYCYELAKSHNNLGILLADLGKRAEAEAQYRRNLALCEKLTADFPAVPEYAVDLGGGYCNFGLLLMNRGEAAASLDWYAKARATLGRVLAKEPHLATARLFLRNVHSNRAQALGQLGRHGEAVADWEQALALNDDRQRDSLYRLERALSLARAGQLDAATAAVENVLKPGNAASGMLYDAACVYALTAAQAAKQTSPNTSSLRAEQYARRAVALLRQAVQKGWKDVAHMKKDTDLNSLRGRDDFKQLLAELEAITPGK